MVFSSSSNSSGMSRGMPSDSSGSVVAWIGATGSAAAKLERHVLRHTESPSSTLLLKSHHYSVNVTCPAVFTARHFTWTMWGEVSNKVLGGTLSTCIKA